MATRLYVSRSAAGTSPTPDSLWDDTASFVRRDLDPTKSGPIPLTQLLLTTTNNTPAGASDFLLVQAISAPIDSNQTIAGNFKAQFHVFENSANADMRSQLVVWVYTGSGSRGTLYAGDTGGLSQEWAVNARTNRKFPRAGSSALSSVSAQTGDRLVVELGCRKHENATTSRNAAIFIGNNPAADDLPENETDAFGTDGFRAGWIEFSQDITFQQGQTLRVSQVVAEILRPVIPGAINRGNVVWMD